MIRCNLSTLMGRDKLRISDVVRETGLNRSTITALYKETATRVDLPAIDLLLLVFTVHEDHDKIFESLKAGVCGYLLKRTPLAQLVSSIEDLVAGGSPMSPAIARKVAEYFQALPGASAGLGELTDREREVLDHIARGRTNKEISTRLNISPHTVDNHIRGIYEKLEVSNRTEAAAKYLAR